MGEWTIGAKPYLRGETTIPMVATSAIRTRLPAATGANRAAADERVHG
ncbi:hypothetical protein [Halalkalicoccus subterraneus]|nr:hypothetical protein [Halalkalicoccus subterraneus]